ncbi:YhdP family protein [Polynucleobacter sp. MWH-UH23A]|uniref:YhdP family protein n=1 Tax=Polynucleobacter sp. MWH-UH23A TaxID=1855613 RepID=UPI003364DD28
MPQNLLPPRLIGLLAKGFQDLSKNWHKRALILAATLAALFVLGHLTVRFVVWPQIEKSKSSVEKLIGARVGVNVSIDDLRVSWTGIRPVFEIDGLRFTVPEQTKPTLSIKKIYGQLSWKSFYHLLPYFHEIHFEGAEIDFQRNTKGVITIAGITIDSGSSDYSAQNWLFSQDLIEAKQVKLNWDDKLNQKSSTLIEVQDLSLTNGIRQHTGSIMVSTPWNQGPAEIKVNFAHHLGGERGDWHNWIGNVSWDFNNLDLKKIADEFQLKLSALEGILSSRGNLKIDNANPDGGEFFVAVDNLVVQASKSEDAIALGRLETKLSQETTDGMIAITTKTFAWREMGSSKSAPLDYLSPMTFRWRPPGADGEIKEFGFSSPKISVEDVALFALNLPLSKKVHQWIKASQAEGDLEDVDIQWAESKSPLSALNIPGGWFKSNKLDFNVSAKLINLSFVGINKSIPSVSNLSGFVTSNQKEGSFSVDSQNLDLEVYDFLDNPKIQLDRATGQVSWSKQRGNWVISTKKLTLSNPEISTNLSLNYKIGNGKEPDFMTLDMDFDQANLKTAYRYLPVGMGKDVRTYLSKAFDAGLIRKGQLHIKGDPNQAPFPDKQQGELTLNLPIIGASFSPAPLLPSNQGAWSTFTGVNGKITMNNAYFAVDIAKANYKQVSLDDFHAEIPNVSANQLILSVNGNAKGDAPQLLEYFYQSPAGKKGAGLEKNLRVTGPINFNLGLKVPLSGSADTNVDLKLNLPGNRAQWGDLPPFENLKGGIRITEVHPEFENVTAIFLGGAINITSTEENKDKQRFKITGDIQSKFMQDYFANSPNPEAQVFLNSMSGSIKYDGLIGFNKTGSDSNLQFDLRNWSINAPAPIKKVNGSTMTGQVNIKTSNDINNTNRISLSGKIGELYTLEGAVSRDAQLRFGLGIGGVATLPQQGFSLNIASNELNLDEWQRFLQTNKVGRTQESKTISTSSANNAQITAQVKKLILFDRPWQDVNLSANNKKSVWELRINSPQASGQIQYQEAPKPGANGLISGRFTKLKIVDQPTPAEATTKQALPPKKALRPEAIPSLDIVIEDFSWSKAQLGQLKVKSTTVDNVLKIDSIQTNNPQGNSTISGQWTGATKNIPDHSTLNIDMAIKDAGQIIAHWTPQKSVEGGQGKVSANVQWDGPPFDPKYETLVGKASLNLEKGRLLEVNSSGAKLLDVLSLQSLFRFATLDLKGSLGNIVTKGTPFNTINGNFDINNGIAQTQQFNMNLDQANMVMSGQINIPKQTQDLRITIFPTIDATAGSLAAFAINPIVGLGALVGQYLLTSQINRGLQSDYLIQGSWDDPEVIPLDQKGQPIDSNTLKTIRSKNLLIEQNKPSANGTTNPIK